MLLNMGFTFLCTVNLWNLRCIFLLVWWNHIQVQLYCVKLFLMFGGCLSYNRKYQMLVRWGLYFQYYHAHCTLGNVQEQVLCLTDHAQWQNEMGSGMNILSRKGLAPNKSLHVCELVPGCRYAKTPLALHGVNSVLHNVIRKTHYLCGGKTLGMGLGQIPYCSPELHSTRCRQELLLTSFRAWSQQQGRTLQLCLKDRNLVPFVLLEKSVMVICKCFRCIVGLTFGVMVKGQCILQYIYLLGCQSAGDRIGIFLLGQAGF